MTLRRTNRLVFTEQYPTDVLMKLIAMIAAISAMCSSPAFADDLYVMSMNGRSLAAADRDSISWSSGRATLALHFINATPVPYEVGMHYEWSQRSIMSVEVDCESRRSRLVGNQYFNFSGEMIDASSVASPWTTAEGGSTFTRLVELVCDNKLPSETSYPNLFQLMANYYKGIHQGVPSLQAE